MWRNIHCLQTNKVTSGTHSSNSNYYPCSWKAVMSGNGSWRRRTFLGVCGWTVSKVQSLLHSMLQHHRMCLLKRPRLPLLMSLVSKQNSGWHSSQDHKQLHASWRPAAQHTGNNFITVRNFPVYTSPFNFTWFHDRVCLWASYILIVICNELFKPHVNTWAKILKWNFKRTCMPVAQIEHCYIL